jgi:hypothetical protein
MMATCREKASSEAVSEALMGSNVLFTFAARRIALDDTGKHAAQGAVHGLAHLERQQYTGGTHEHTTDEHDGILEEHTGQQCHQAVQRNEEADQHRHVGPADGQGEERTVYQGDHGHQHQHGGEGDHGYRGEHVHGEQCHHGPQQDACGEYVEALGLGKFLAFQLGMCHEAAGERHTTEHGAQQ